VIAGAVLTQNTAWGNVEKALANFGGKLSPGAVAAMPEKELAEVIRPAGFFNQKAAYLKAVTAWYKRYGYDAAAVRRRPLKELRAELLATRGVGQETADSILLYAFGFPTFVVDAYTHRLCGRYPVDAGKGYAAVKAHFEAGLPKSAEVYNRFHALIVMNAKEHCRKKPACGGCPLAEECKKHGCASSAKKTAPGKRLLLVSPRGFCAGVERAIKTVEQALEREQTTIFVLKEIVHNTVVVRSFKERGVVFVDSVDEVPAGSVIVFSAHGVAPSVRRRAQERRLRVIDATCPLVTKVHAKARRYAEEGYSIVLIGHEDHDEVAGIVGEAPEKIRVVKNAAEIDALEGLDPERLVWLSQTTLNTQDTAAIVEQLRRRYPKLADPPNSDICYATQNRQTAVKSIAAKCDLFVIVGSANSSNANRLAEAALSSGARRVARVDSPDELSRESFDSLETIGVSSGASVPDSQLKNVMNHILSEHGATVEEVVAVEEEMVFPLPK
jgi:4-hydroxy-3-methylbut-2-enyl diphosphate reductase